MARWTGKIGFGVQTEVRPAVWKDVIEEHKYSGEITRNTRSLQVTDNLNDDITVANEISILADPFAHKNFHSMRYVEFMGDLWKITKVDVRYPRLILTIGGVYNGERP